MVKKFLFLCIAMIGAATMAHGQRVAVKTNMLYWATASLNAGVDVAVSDRSTLGLSVSGNPWTVGSRAKIQHFFAMPEYRYWFCGKYTRGFLMVQALAGKYTVGGFKLPFDVFPSFREHHYKGWAAGAGIGYGYAWYLGAHWNLEASLAVGYARMRYHRTDHPETKVSRNYVGPTHIGVSFVYLFNSKKL